MKDVIENATRFNQPIIYIFKNVSAWLATMNITHFSQLVFNCCAPNRRVLGEKHVAFMGKAESYTPQPVWAECPKSDKFFNSMKLKLHKNSWVWTSIIFETHILHIYTRNKQSVYDVTGCVICISSIVEYLNKTVNYQKSYICNFTKHFNFGRLSFNK